MTRRSRMDGIFQQASEKLATANFEDEAKESRVPAGPIKSMALTLDKMENEAKALQEAMISGQYVQELDPELIEPSFVRDRMDEIAFADDDPFLRSIADNGQEVPILVRPHPQKEGRYQVAYGHRRLKAVTQLGIKVRAVVREFDDTALVVAQGIENSGRENLSYIERAVFALALEQRGFKRSDIMQALSTDKTELSKLISVALTVPASIVSAIGSAKGIGRRKWQALASAYSDDRQDDIERLLQSQRLKAKNSDERFEAVLALLSETSRDQEKGREWKPRAGGPLNGTIKASSKSFSLTLSTKEAGPFGQYLSDKLDDLYDDYLKQKEN
ncbi:plasmid partitioning protein RepB [Agrobacterium vitis]|uniref:plasmid partitioning protein RepB n=1 Tax=Agrobacterium vitis TaxID=373 RepID=UPI0015717E7F|nr:plasmid partitioning protein RepB [Agrobacterium vitis]NSZ19527.1 plasmid partitioning protein RepB [Agrobacterium vitis]QZO06835.1 plasmid partitioning protein RepB [Agrobacterium vitis]UJL91496.1 plasmid partitioning protein RepB [Agrobacterium vitis]